MFIEFDVFGKRMSVQRKQGQWLLFVRTGTGLRTRVHDVVIPADLEESALAGYPRDIYHEHGSAKAGSVKRLK